MGDLHDKNLRCIDFSFEYLACTVHKYFICHSSNAQSNICPVIDSSMAQFQRLRGFIRSHQFAESRLKLPGNQADSRFKY